METLSIESREPVSLNNIRDLVAHVWRVEGSAGNTLVIHGNTSRAYLHPDAESIGREIHRLLLDYCNERDVNHFHGRCVNRGVTDSACVKPGRASTDRPARLGVRWCVLTEG